VTIKNIKTKEKVEIMWQLNQRKRGIKFNSVIWM